VGLTVVSRTYVGVSEAGGLRSRASVPQETGPGFGRGFVVGSDSRAAQRVRGVARFTSGSGWTTAGPTQVSAVPSAYRAWQERSPPRTAGRAEEPAISKRAGQRPASAPGAVMPCGFPQRRFRWSGSEQGGDGGRIKKGRDPCSSTTAAMPMASSARPTRSTNTDDRKPARSAGGRSSPPPVTVGPTVNTGRVGGFRDDRHETSAQENIAFESP
jgi:hypothetical protein